MTAGNYATKGSGAARESSGRTVLLRYTPDYALGCVADVFVTIWRQMTTVDGARMVDAECGKFAVSQLRGVGLLTVVEARTPMPNAQARAALAEFMQAAGRYTRASAVIFEGNSFRASAVRGVATGLTLLARQPFPHKLFVDAREAANFLAHALGDGSGQRSVDDLCQAPTRLRELIAKAENRRTR